VLSGAEPSGNLAGTCHTYKRVCVVVLKGEKGGAAMRNGSHLQACVLSQQICSPRATRWVGGHKTTGLSERVTKATRGGIVIISNGGGLHNMYSRKVKRVLHKRLDGHTSVSDSLVSLCVEHCACEHES